MSHCLITLISNSLDYSCFVQFKMYSNYKIAHMIFVIEGFQRIAGHITINESIMSGLSFMCSYFEIREL